MTTDTQSIIRLMTWLSPAFPVGAFAYSGGLEAAVHSGHVNGHEDLADWIETLLRHGTLFTDSLLLAEAFRAVDDTNRLRSVSDLALALAGSSERYLEVTAQGEAFMAAARAWPHPALEQLDAPIAYCVAVGRVAAANSVPLESAIAAFLHAASSQLISAAIRCSVLGQKQGVALLATLEETILSVAKTAAHSTLDDLGTATILADLMAIRHETLHSRIFRS